MITSRQQWKVTLEVVRSISFAVLMGKLEGQ